MKVMSSTINNKQTPDLSVIVVNYNGASYIAQCLESILNHKTKYNIELIVIDNNSVDESKHVLSNYKSTCKLVFNDKNLGFSVANNQGLNIAKGEYVLLLNNDTVVHEKVVDTLIDYFKTTSNIGALSPKLVYPNGSLQRHGSILGAWRFLGKTPRKVPFIIGAACMLKTDILRSIGG